MRENQGPLIGIIILFLLLLIACIAAFMGIQKANELSDEVAGLKTDLATQKSSAEAYQIQSQNLQAYIGFEGTTFTEAAGNMGALDQLVSQGDDSVKQIRDDAYKLRDEFDADMKKYASGEQVSYRTLSRDLASVAGSLHGEKVVLENENKRIESKTKAEVAAKIEELKQANDNLNVAVANYEKEKDGRIKDIATLQKELDGIDDVNKAINRSSEEKLLAANKLRKTAEDANVVLIADNDELKAKIDEYEREVFDLPDGRILGISPEIQMVVVNLGSDDGLRTNTSFSVYSKAVTNFQKDKHKAMIEITRIVGAHQAEGRITFEEGSNPIVRGDHILTATWDPGYRVPIALAGVFDTDRDGNSDLKALISQIERNSGKVVAYHDEDGNLVGSIDSSTRFFVLGTAPDTDDKNYAQIVAAIRTLGDQAERYAVQHIDTKKLHNWMGVHQRLQIQRLDDEMGNRFRRRDPADSLLKVNKNQDR